MVVMRKKIWPRAAGDLASMVFVLIVVPLIYWFGLWVVLPELYNDECLFYTLHFILGTFIMLNIVGNFTYTILCDTSTIRNVMQISTAKPENGWWLCTVCESVSPPRSWHCHTCDTCILKRNHHCVFVGYCVGFYNHRYFIMFLWYSFVGAAYAFYYGTFFMWHRIPFEPFTIVRLVFPIAIFFFGIDMSADQFYMVAYAMSFVGTLYTAVLFIYHFNLILKGAVSYESNKKDYTYNMGWKDNIKEVFGERWYITWFLPYIPSQLPHDGTSWCNLYSKDD